MLVRILGTAAGGGLPQWNCNCLNCRDARARGAVARRLQAALALSPDGIEWYLINASPEVNEQLAGTPALAPGPGIRQSPLRGVILTSAELDHTIGLLSLREGGQWCLYATPGMRQLLETAFPVLPILRAYSPAVTVQEIIPESSFLLGNGARQVRVHVTATSGHVPLYGRRHTPTPAPDVGTTGGEVALTFEDLRSGRRLTYAPGVPELTPALRRELSQADCILIDGTFWQDDELIAMRIGTRSALDMDHLPISGREGTAQWLCSLPAPDKRYIHINNTNPVLAADSPERRRIQKLGLDLAEEGWEIEL